MPVVVVSGKVYRLLVERSGACAVNLFRHGEVDGAAHISEGGVATLTLHLAEAEGAEVDDVEVEDIDGAVCEAGVVDIGDGIDTQREMQQVKDYCSQLCREYGLSVTESKADLFRIPMWKRRLTDHIKEAMEQSRTQQEFVAYMNAYGYDVKWEPHQKYITYTTPENIRCRDSKLFDQTLKRENMELYFRLGGADYLQACREIAYDHREPTPTLEDAVCGMAGTVAAICALCEDEDSEVSDLARELYYSSLLLQELVEWYQSRRQEQENYEEEYEQYHGFDMTMM